MGENRRQHIEFIQNNIIRMNQLSFQIKEMGVAILTALLGVYAAVPSKDGTQNEMYMYIAIIPVLILWCLDSYYLQQERKFRGLYNDVRKGKESRVEKYDMPLGLYQGGRYSYIRCLVSKTEVPYFVIIVALLVGARLL